MSFTVVKHYITDQEAESVLSYLNSTFTGKTGVDRQVQRFGLTNSYASNKVSNTIPPALQYLCDKLEGTGYCSDVKHVTVNRYDVGQSIPYHIDNRESGDVITIISLNSDGIMLFKDDKSKVTEHIVPANSLIQFSDDHRWKLKHSLAPATRVRYSIVFRKH